MAGQWGVRLHGMLFRRRRDRSVADRGRIFRSGSGVGARVPGHLPATPRAPIWFPRTLLALHAARPADHLGLYPAPRGRRREQDGNAARLDRTIYADRGLAGIRWLSGR